MTPIDDARRIYPLRDFPYSIIYRERPNQPVRILVVRHQHRDPNHGEFRR